MRCYTALKNVGGITGRAGSTVGGEVENCYNTGLITAETIGGGVIGHIPNFTFLSNCYYSDTSCDYGIGFNNSVIAVDVSQIKSIKYDEMVGNNAVSTMKLNGDIWVSQSDGTPLLAAFQPGYVDIDPDETTAPPDTTEPDEETTAPDTNTQQTTSAVTTSSQTTNSAGTTSSGDDNAKESNFKWVITLIVFVAALAVVTTIYLLKRQRNRK